MPGGTASDAGTLATALREFIADRVSLPRAGVRVENMARMAGGASRELWSLDVGLAYPGREAETLQLVLRRDPPGRGDEGDRGLEFRLLQAAAAAGVPVPRVHWSSDDPRVLGTSFFLMDRLAGETIPRRLLRDDEYAGVRQGMARELGRILARIHTVDLEADGLQGLERPAAGRSPGLDQLERLATAVETLAPEPHPVLVLAERWLRERAPRGDRMGLVHGDFRVGNVLFDRQAVRAVLDWELAHVGDPVEDLGWLCTRAWRFGSEAPAGGVGTREELLDGYAEAGGAVVDRDSLRFWETLGSFKVAVVFIQQAQVFLSGKLPSVELASLGRRTAEAEAELLRMLEDRP